MTKMNVPVDYQGFEIRRAKFHLLSTDPSLASGDTGRFWYDSTNNLFKGWDGSKLVRLTNLLESVVGSGALKATSIDVNKAITLSVDAASASVPGTMSSAHYNLLAGATSVKTPNTVVLRDSSGIVNADLVGTALNATNLGNATLAQVRDFSLTTGQRDYTAISGFDARVQASRLDQLTAPTAPVAFGSQRITGVADPVNPQDGATKNYVDNVATGLDTKPSAVYGTTAALPANTYANGTSGQGATLTGTANGALAVDGQTPVVGQRILVKNEPTAANNGLYVVTQVGSGSAPFILTRANDADTSAEVTGGMFVFVEAGNSLGGTGWVLTGTGTFTLGTTSLVFTQFTGGAAYTNGNGLSLSGNQFSVLGTAGRISVSASGVDIAATYVGQTSITTLGAIGAGTWQGTAVGIGYGGTGATTAAGARANLAAVGKYAAALPAITAGGSVVITHNLGTTDLIGITIVNQSTGEPETFDIDTITTTQLTVRSGVAVAAGAYRIAVAG